MVRTNVYRNSYGKIKIDAKIHKTQRTIHSTFTKCLILIVLDNIILHKSMMQKVNIKSHPYK